MRETAYARSGDINIAYQVIGEGDRDLVYVPGWVSNIDLMWDDPGLAGFLRRLSSFSRLITFDKRGTGLSDPVSVSELPDLSTRMDDLRAVMDDAGSERATIFGHSEGGNLSLLFAATHPDRTERLILTGSYAKRIRTEDYPWAPSAEEREQEALEMEADWGNAIDISIYAPSRTGDEAFVAWLSRYQRMSASPHTVATLMRMNTQIDTTPILSSIKVPTLLLYREDDRDVSIEEGRYISKRIPDSRFVALPGGDHFFWAGDAEQMLQEIEEFVTGHRGSILSERRLATVLFTDIVDSTAQAAELGDRKWRELLERHHQVTRSEFARWRGSEVDPAGDGFLATFDSPSRAIECALAICSAVRSLGIEVRAGIHTGEVEVVGDGVAGIAVHIGARVAGEAGPGEVLVSSTVKGLLLGSRFGFDDRGAYDLKGVPGSWQLHGVSLRP